MRLEKCYNKHECYFCQRQLSESPIASKTELSYAQAKKNVTVTISGVNLRCVEPEIEREVRNLLTIRCNMCNTAFRTEKDLEDHMKTHNRRVCTVCLSTGRFLPSEIPSFGGDFSDHKKLHPKCLCCNFIAFDTKSLETHMTQNHERCDVCLQLNRIVWLKNAMELIEHCERVHFICHYPDCQASGLIAFATRAELLTHLRRAHGEMTRDIDLTTDFECLSPASGEDHTRKKMIELNRRFITRLRSLFDDETVIEALKNEARALITNKIGVQEFYSKFSSLCQDKKNAIFTDMVAIMPDPKKRAELLRIHENVGGKSPSQTQEMRKSWSLPEVARNLKVETRHGTGPQQEMESPTQIGDQHQPKRRRKQKKVVLYMT